MSAITTWINLAIMDDENIARERLRRIAEGWSWDIPKPGIDNSPTKPLLWTWLLLKAHKEMLLSNPQSKMPDPDSITVKARILVSASTPKDFDQKVEERTQLRNIDVVLSDIVVPGGEDGLMFAKRWQEAQESPVFIMVSAFPDKAVEAFSLEVADYVVKPVRGEVLGAALCRALSKKAAKESAGSDFGKSLLEIVENKKRKEDELGYLTVIYSGKLTNIQIDDIAMFKADMKYTMAKTKTKGYILETSLKRLQEMYGDKFLKVHRGCLVSLYYIEGLYNEPRRSISGKITKGRVWYIKLKGFDKDQEKVEISRRLWGEVALRLGINPVIEYKKDFVPFTKGMQERALIK